MRYLLLAAAILGVAVLALLFPASGDTPLLTENFPALLIVGAVIAISLLALVGWQLWQLRRRIRAGVFGSKLTFRLMLWFGLVALLPATVVFGASVFFLNRSIETWFDVRVDTALGSGVNLGQAALDDMLLDLTKKTERMALALSDVGTGSAITMLSSLREQAAVNEATLFDEKGGVVATAAGENAGLLPDIPERAILWQVLQEKAYSRVDDLPEKGLVMRVLVPVYSSSFAGETRVLQVLHAVPPSLARDAEAVQSAYRDYQEIAASRLGLKRMYGMALTLTLLLALLLTIALAYLLSDKMGAPLRTLARGTRAVAKGDFSQMHSSVQSRDELGALIQSFNDMTRQLSEARIDAERNQLQTEQAKAYLESVLANLSSGVVALDHRLRVRAINDAAARILEADGNGLSGKPVVEWGDAGTPLRKFGEEVAERFIAAEGEDWNAQLEFPRPGHMQILLARGSKLPAEVQGGYTLVFDDVTKLIRAERDAAWGEVARRLAHEIKNPLTPIQLSAERLSLRLKDKLAGSDAEMLTRATATIINQVGAMKSMVDAFASYARMPSAQIARLDLNALVREVLTLYDGSNVQPELAPELPLAAGDSTLMRQVIHNLLQNAQDALAGKPDGRIGIRTEAAEDFVRLAVMDNGSGFPAQMMVRMFEPYATTKPKGTGLGLPIVKKIVEELKGSIRVENLSGGGASVSVSLPVYKGSTGGKQ